MPKRKEKLKGVTFQLVHRSQQDPLVADDNAPQRVLVPIAKKETKEEKEKRLEEQHKYGVYFDDDYNYLQHLKDPKENRMEWPEHVDKALEERKEQQKMKLELPSSVFASEIEEEVGMLRKAAPVSGPQLHLDPDLVAAMDEDFDYDNPDNELEDNFMELAEGVPSDNEFLDENDEYEYSDVSSTEMDEARSPNQSEKLFGKEETKSRFTNYSMTSSVIRRNEQLTLLDARFEHMFPQYDDSEIGALDTEEIEGHIPLTSDILLQYADEFEKSQKREQLDEHNLTDKILQLYNNQDGEDEMKVVKVVQKKPWDCQTILSTYSNKHNLPKTIEQPKSNKIMINKKTGIPINILDENRLTVNALNQLEQRNGVSQNGVSSIAGQSVISKLSTLSIRPKDETPDDKRERKRAFREYKKERRIEKKLNKEAFKEEAKRQGKIALNNQNNVQGNRLL